MTTLYGLKCKACGYEEKPEENESLIPPNYCPMCGTKLSGEEITSITSNANFCPDCGSKLSEEEA